MTLREISNSSWNSNLTSLKHIGANESENDTLHEEQLNDWTIRRLSEADRLQTATQQFTFDSNEHTD